MTEVAVLGAGPAGCAAAIALARAGRAVLLLERCAAPREVVCGEFLGPDAAAALAALGLDPTALGAVPLRRLRGRMAGGRPGRRCPSRPGPCRAASWMPRCRPWPVPPCGGG